MTGISQQLSPAENLADTLARSRMLICPKCRTTYSSTALASCYRDGEQLVDYEGFVAMERDPLRGAVIGGKYRLLERVGQGGMGTVHRAHQTGLNRSVAVKVLKRELNVDPDTVARFHREANAMSLLTHPNTVRVYDFGQTEDGLLYLVMELLEGELITSKMAREGPLDVLEAVRLTQQILRSLAEAHKKAIVHRDLKPDNVFVARVDGHGVPVVKVLDFGIAKVVAPDRRVDQFETQAGTVFGTPRYMSPEQAQGAPLDGRSDLYSVGTLLYQMLAGRAPFTDDDAVVVMAKHIREMPVAPIVLAPERPIPRSLNDVVMRALAKDPATRFQEAAEFDAALEVCIDEVVAAQAAAATGRWSHRADWRVHWLYAASAIALFAVGYFGVRVYAKLNTRAPERVTSVPIVSAAPPVAPSSSEAPPSPAVASETEAAEVAEGVGDHVVDGANVPSPAAPIDVAVQSRPRGAAVYRNGKLLGETPLKVRLSPEEEMVRVELRLEGYQPLAAELTAGEGSRLLALAPLARGKHPHKVGRPRAGRAGAGAPKATGESRKAAPNPANAPTAPDPAAEPAPSPKPPRGPYERFE